MRSWKDGHGRYERVRAHDVLTCPAGQIVGDMREVASVRQVAYAVMEDRVDARGRLNAMLG